MRLTNIHHKIVLIWNIKNLKNMPAENKDRCQDNIKMDNG